MKSDTFHGYRTDFYSECEAAEYWKKITGGLGLKLRKEKVIASMTPIGVPDFIPAKLEKVGEGQGQDDDQKDEEEEEGNPIPTEPQYTMPEVPLHIPQVHNWESMMGLQYHFHEEQNGIVEGTWGDSCTTWGNSCKTWSDS
nr:hypothetical protein Itr_chr04CG14750 [Ipomoea trifida]